MYVIIYYACEIPAAYTPYAFISEISDESISITFKYNVPDSDVTLPATSYGKIFYVLERSNFNANRTTIIFKSGDNIIKTEDYKEELYGS